VFSAWDAPWLSEDLAGHPRLVVTEDPAGKAEFARLDELKSGLNGIPTRLFQRLVATWVATARGARPLQIVAEPDGHRDFRGGDR
jgi:hypothetical protein